ncbi:hypothetical protein J6590_064195 [Homalodisca vitripennis]|nr:hypothetical protein J6590_064195 [Homalodisca vitripennis]
MEHALGRGNRAEILGCVPSLQALEMGKNLLRPYGRHYRSKSLDFGSELEIALVQILSVIVALFISTIDLTVSTPPLTLFDKIIAQASGS